MKVLFVCGKGGVGKTAVTASLARIYSRINGVLAITLDSTRSLAFHLGCSLINNIPEEISSRLYALHCSKEDILKHYICEHFKFRSVSDWILNHPLYEHLTNVTPGLKELLILDHIFSFTDKKFRNQWQTIIVDMPSTGHGVNILNVMNMTSNAMQHGPLRKKLITNRDRLQNPDLCRAVIVTIPEELPVQESRELILKLQNKVSLVVETVIMNNIERVPVSMDTMAALDSISDDQLQHLITQYGKSTFQPEISAVRTAIHLQTTRAKHAEKIIESFVNWWQESVICLPHFHSFQSEDISKQMTESLCGEYLP